MQYISSADGTRENAVMSKQRELSTTQLQSITEELRINGAGHSEPFSGYPDLSGLSIRDQMIMLAAVHGYSQNEIAEVFHLGQSAVSKIIKRIDPAGVFCLGEEAKKAFISQRAWGLTLEVLTAITPEKMFECSVPQATRAIKTLAEIAATADREVARPSGFKKVNKVIVEFIDPLAETQGANIEVDSVVRDVKH